MDLSEASIRKFLRDSIEGKRVIPNGFTDDTQFSGELAIKLNLEVMFEFLLTEPVLLNSPFTVNTLTKAIMASVEEGRPKEKKGGVWAWLVRFFGGSSKRKEEEDEDSSQKKCERLHPDQLPKREEEVRSARPGKVENLMIYLGLPPETMLTSYEGMKALMESEELSSIDLSFYSRKGGVDFSREEYSIYLGQEELFSSFLDLLSQEMAEDISDWDEIVYSLKLHWYRAQMEILCAAMVKIAEVVTPSFHQKDLPSDSLEEEDKE